MMPSGGGAGRTTPASPPRWAGRAFRCSGVVLHSLLALVPSSTSTTPSGPNRSSAVPVWCFTSRKPLFLRHRAPRPRARTGLPLFRRGASLPASPYFFVDRHHAPGLEPAFRCPGVVLPPPQSLVPSSTGTTPRGPNGPSCCSGVVLHSPLVLIPSSTSTTPPGPEGLRPGLSARVRSDRT